MRLLIKRRGTLIGSYSPADSPLELGRQASSRIRFDEPVVSRSHGRFVWSGAGGWAYEDTSRSGTHVISDSSVRLLLGDSVSLKGTCELRLAPPDGPSLFCTVEDDEPPLGARDLFRRAQSAIGGGNYQSALEDYLVIARSPNPPPEALRQAALCLVKLGRVQDALLWATRYAYARPGHAEGWKQLASLQISRGQLEDARSSVEMARSCDGGDPALGQLENRLLVAQKAATPLAMSSGTILGGMEPQSLETRHFRITFDLGLHGRLITDLAKSLEVAALRYSELLPKPPLPIRVALVETMQGHKEGGVTLHQQSAASCDAEIIRIHLPENSVRAVNDRPYLSSLAFHEVMHAFLLGLSDDLPWWLHEGLAQYASLGANREEVMRPPEGGIELASFEKHPSRPETDIAYALAHFAVIGIIRRLGEEGFSQLISANPNKAKLRLALERLGMDYGTLTRTALQLWRDSAPPAEANFVTTIIR